MVIQPAIDPRTGLPIPIATTGDTGPPGPAGAPGPTAHRQLPISYISATGTAGVDNTAQVVKSISLPANTLTQVGDRLRIRAYWTGTTGTAVTGTLSLNAVTIGHTTDAGAANLQTDESYVHYIDNTHANIIEDENGTLGAVSAINVVGFDFASPQTIALSQDAIANNHIIVYEIIVDLFPKGA